LKLGLSVATRIAAKAWHAVCTLPYGRSIVDRVWADCLLPAISELGLRVRLANRPIRQAGFPT